MSMLPVVRLPVPSSTAYPQTPTDKINSAPGSSSPISAGVVVNPERHKKSKLKLTISAETVASPVFLMVMLL